MIVASSYTATSSGWGVWFLAVILLLAVVVWVVAAITRLVISSLHRHRRSDLTPLRPLPLRKGHHR